MRDAQETALFKDTTLAILAGGAGERMGRPKGHLTLGNQPILDYLLDHLDWPGQTLLVTAPGREHPPGWKRFHREVTDPVSGAGPLRGVLTALENIKTSLLLVLTIDMPGIRLPHGAFLLDAVRNDSKILGAMMCRNATDPPQIEPFPLLINIKAKPIVALRLAAGKRSVHGLLEEPGFKTIPAPLDWPAKVWTNLNVPDDLLNFTP